MPRFDCYATFNLVVKIATIEAPDLDAAEEKSMELDRPSAPFLCVHCSREFDISTEPLDDGYFVAPARSEGSDD
jgi:hypothetical protein